MSFHLIRFTSFCLFLIIFINGSAQQSGRDSTRRFPSFSGNGLKPYREVITEKAKTDEGMFRVHKVEDKWYFEIPDTLLGLDIMVVNRIAKSSVNVPKFFGGY